jgi:hypothetical protein
MILMRSGTRCRYPFSHHRCTEGLIDLRVFLAPFRTGTAHIVQFGPIGIEQFAPSPSNCVEAARRRVAGEQNPQDIRI